MILLFSSAIFTISEFELFTLFNVSTFDTLLISVVLNDELYRTFQD